ncbi:hypothetical protein BKA64DRAFT_408541 [Cadophora sp. MPI-SDFR-AT-0126]|nr:hypothetical protein BKA64DRAFT_408541 [Leotiomycetes sp. MPI-SDFR-AT-0126]
MSEALVTPKTQPVPPPADGSEDEANGDQQPMIFNFDGPQSNEEVRDQALLESASFNGRSQSTESSQSGAIAQPISFNFGPQPVEAQEAVFNAALSTGLRGSQMPAGARELAAAINNRRRAATNRAFRGVATAYIDEDESGTYDPKRARKTPPSPSRPAKRVKTSNAVNKDGTLVSKKPTKQIGFRYEMLVKLKFHSKKALDYLRALPVGPYGSQSSNADEELDFDDDSGYGGSYKRKREAKQPRRLGAAITRSDGLTIDDLSEGHPQRRGCRCCFNQGSNECTLIEQPDEYPCEACDDAETDCVLIIPPKFKKACLRCKGKRRNCSYSLDGGKGVDACDACEEEGITCCAEPLTDSRVVRRFANLPARVKFKPNLAASEPVRERMYVSCNQCRSTGKRCTIRGKADLGPCSNCRKAGQTCKFVHPLTRTPQLPASSYKTKKLSISSTHCAKSDSSTPPRDRMGTAHSPNTLTATIYSELEKKNTRKAERLFAKGTTHIHITTSFCHPITFNYVPDPLLKNPCSWCDNPFYGLWGLASTSGPRKVEGFYYPNGGGFEEVFGGFSELGYSRSVMCIACTYARVRITQCPAHRLRALDVKMGEFDLDVLSEEKWGKTVKAYQDGDMKGAELVRKAKWCSVCPAAAALKCCSPQLFDENGEPASAQQHAHGGGCEGCGLLLCQDCAELLGKLIRGGARTGGRQLDSMVSEVKRNRWRFTEGVRADAEFLTSGGDLLRSIGEGLGASEGKRDEERELKVSNVKGEGAWIAGAGSGGVEGERKRDRDCWMRGEGNGTDVRGDEMSRAIKAKKTVGENGMRGGRELMNGSTGTSMRPSSSTTSSSSTSFNTNIKNERRPSNTNHSSQNYQNHPSRARGDTISMPPPICRSSHSSSTSLNPWPSTSHNHSSSQRGINNTRGTAASYTGTSNGYAYGTGQKGIKRERDTRGEIMFGGFLKERKEDVEKAFRGQVGVIDLTDDD